MWTTRTRAALITSQLTSGICLASRTMSSSSSPFTAQSLLQVNEALLTHECACTLSMDKGHAVTWKAFSSICKGLDMGLTLLSGFPDRPFVGRMYTGDLITLEGAGAYNAAMHCASVSASKRGGKKSSPKFAHERTNSSLAALGGEPITRPSAHARSRSMGSASEHSSGSGDVIPSGHGDMIDNIHNLTGIHDDMDGIPDDMGYDLAAGQMSADDIYNQMPLKRRLRALGKRMMRSLRLSSPMP